MATRREITKKYAADYAKSSKNAKGLILDELVAITGWSRANARRALWPPDFGEVLAATISSRLESYSTALTAVSTPFSTPEAQHR